MVNSTKNIQYTMRCSGAAMFSITFLFPTFTYNCKLSVIPRINETVYHTGVKYIVSQVRHRIEENKITIWLRYDEDPE